MSKKHHVQMRFATFVHSYRLQKNVIAIAAHHLKMEEGELSDWYAVDAEGIAQRMLIGATRTFAIGWFAEEQRRAECVGGTLTQLRRMRARLPPAAWNLPDQPPSDIGKQ